MNEKRCSCVIFDLGNVLVHFKEEILTAPYFPPEEREQAGRVIFARAMWDRLDAGTVENDEVHAFIRAHLPERMHAAAIKCYANWFYNLPEIDGMREVVEELRARGVPVYLLSNIGRDFAAHEDAVPILRLTDGHIYSSLCGMTKPDPAIFRYAAAQFGHAPEECLFVDDLPKNTEGARRAGMRSYTFDGNVDALKAFLGDSL